MRKLKIDQMNGVVRKIEPIESEKIELTETTATKDEEEKEEVTLESETIKLTRAYEKFLTQNNDVGNLLLTDKPNIC